MLAQGIGRGANEGLKAYTDYRLEQQENQSIKDRTGLDLQGIRDPNTRNAFIADQLQRGRKIEKNKFLSDNQNQSTQTLNNPNRNTAEEFDVFEEEPEKKLNKQKKQKYEDRFFEEGGNLPIQTTRDKPVHVLNGQEIEQLAQHEVSRAAEQGIDYSLDEARNKISNMNQQNAVYNQQIELDKNARKTAQRDYGNLAVTKLTNLVPGASDEVQSYFRKIGERAASANKSEAGVDSIVSESAKDYKNALSSVRKSLTPSRGLTKVGRLFTGNETDTQKQIDKLRNQIKPLIDMGLNDTARAELATVGWYPEEVESIIDNIGPFAKQQINTLPSAPKHGSKEYKNYEKQGAYKGFQKNNYPVAVDTLKDILTENPEENLILLRKEFEDRGYGWRTFSQAINELLDNGEIQLSQDQMNKMNRINEPPLSMLDQLAYDFGFGGR